jgi:hypothetical protein
MMTASPKKLFCSNESFFSVAFSRSASTRSLCDPCQRSEEDKG